jgi:hypothetical protein
VDSLARIERVCIQENPKVEVSDFLTVVRDGFDRHGIATEVFSGTAGTNCSAILTNTARRAWDMATYLSHAELRLERDGRQLEHAEYHVNRGVASHLQSGREQSPK